jgi:drug/metabolite transporter (DMT)-like permease
MSAAAPRSSHVAAVQWALIGAMAVWGLNVTVVKALTAWFDPLSLAVVRMVVACATLTAVMLWRRCGVPRASGRQLGALLTCAVLMVYANQILFTEGLLRSTATNGALIMALSPLVSSMLAAVVFREPLTLQRTAGVALGFCGVAAVVFSHPDTSMSSATVGDVLLVAAMVSFAAGGVLIQGLARTFQPLSISWAIYTIGAFLLVLHAALVPSTLQGQSLFPGIQPWLLVLYSGVGATAIGNLIWNRAIAAIGVARTAVFFYLVPVFGVAFSALLLGEALTLWHLAGFVAVMTGTWLGTKQGSALPVAAGSLPLATETRGTSAPPHATAHAAPLNSTKE